MTQIFFTDLDLVDSYLKFYSLDQLSKINIFIIFMAFYFFLLLQKLFSLCLVKNFDATSNKKMIWIRSVQGRWRCRRRRKRQLRRRRWRQRYRPQQHRLHLRRNNDIENDGNVNHINIDGKQTLSISSSLLCCDAFLISACDERSLCEPFWLCTVQIYITLHPAPVHT